VYTDVALTVLCLLFTIHSVQFMSVCLNMAMRDRPCSKANTDLVSDELVIDAIRQRHELIVCSKLMHNAVL